MTDKQIIARLRRKPKTAGELGVSLRTLRKLEAQGLIREVGPRHTGQRGRPPVEFEAVEQAEPVGVGA